MSQAMAPLAYPTNALDRGLQLIQLVRDEGSIRVMDAAQELGVSRSSAHRLLQALVYRDFLVQDEDHIYHPGPALSAGTAHLAWSRLLREIATPHMDDLVARVGNAANLMIPVDWQVRFLKSVTFAGGTYDRRGSIMTAHKTAGGKAMLSRLENSTLEERYLASDQETALLPADFDRLMEQIERSRKLDFATSIRELERTVSAIGVALRGENDRTLGALTISVKNSDAPFGKDLVEIVHQLHVTRSRIESDIRGADAPY